MQRMGASIAAFATWHLVWLLVSAEGQGLPRMNTTVAREHVGEVAIVCGHVIGYGCTESGGSLELATDDRRSAFAIRIPRDRRERFGPYPEEQHLQKLVCASGRIDKRDSQYGSRYEIILSDPSSIAALADRPDLPLFAPDVARPCDANVVLPKARREVKPQYTRRAMNERAQGEVFTQAVVKEDGRVGDVRVVRGLHQDLDEEALKAVRQWRFAPGTLNGQPVPVVVSIELTFTLRN